MDKSKIAIGLGLIALIVAGVGFFNPKTIEVIKERVVEKVGSVVGPDFYGPYWAVNEVKKYYFSSGINTASSTACSFRAPINSTSTLIYGAVKIITGTSSASVWEFGKNNTTFDATTTTLGYVVVGAGIQGTIIASTSPTSGQLDPPVVFGPGAYLNIKQGGDGAITSCTANCTTVVGVCKAIFVEN